MALFIKSKIILITCALVIIAGFIFNKTIYKPHAKTETTEAVYTGTTVSFLKKIKNNAAPWQGKVIELSGVITAIDAHGLVLDHTIYCQLSDSKQTSRIKEKKSIRIKGRVIGYDDLLEELKLDKTIILKY